MVGDVSNIQDGSVPHVDEGFPLHIGRGVVVRHFGPNALSISATAMGIAMAVGALLYATLNHLFGGAKYTISVALL